MSEQIFLDGIKFISVSAAAALSGLSHAYINRLCREGRILGRRIGTYWYVGEESFGTFLLKQGYAKQHKREALTQDRVQEYRTAIADATHRVMTASADVRTPSTEAHTLLVRALEKHGDRLLAGAARAASAPAGLAHAAFSAPHVPAHTIVPLAELFQKLTALTLAFTFTFGTYALVDPQYARYAARTLAGDVRSMLSAYHAVTDGGVGVLVAQAQSQVAAAAEQPHVAASVTAVALADGAMQLARAINTHVDAVVYSIAFPAQLVRPFGIASSARGSVVVQVSTTSRPTSRITTMSSEALVSPSTTSATAQTNLNSNPTDNSATQAVGVSTVVERVVERQTILAAGGLTEEILAVRLQELDNKLSAKIFNLTSANSSSPYVPTPIITLAQSTRIDTLSGVSLSHSTWTGGSITNAAITGGSVDASALSGAVAVSSGGTGTTTAPTYGQLLLGNAQGGYDLVATSSLGISGTAFSLLSSENTWTALQLFSAGASTTDISVFDTLFVGSTATTTISGVATSTFGAGIQATALNVTSPIATSTFASGINISNGCFSVNGTCLTGGAGASTWGSITGTLSSQTDLQAALDARLSLSAWYATTTDALAEGSNLYYTSARATASFIGNLAATTSVASITALPNLSTVSTSLSGFLKATDGALSTTFIDLVNDTTGTLTVGKGGTGVSSFGQGWLYSSGGTGALAASTSPTINYLVATSTTATSSFAGPLEAAGLSTGPYLFGAGLSVCSGSNKLTWSGGSFGCAIDQTGSGSGGGSWSTTTSQVAGRLINYPNNSSDIVAIGNNATTTASYWFDPNNLIAYLSGKVGIGTSTPAETLSVQGNQYTSGTAFFGGAITATSSLSVAGNTTLANATSSSFAITGIASSLLKTNSSGSVVAAVAGTDYLNSTGGDWTGTFDGQEGSYYLNANNLTNFGAPFYSYFSATTTDALAQGSTNRYYSDSLVNTYLHASTTLAKTYTANTFTALQSFSNASSTAISGTISQFTTASSTNLTISSIASGSLLKTTTAGAVTAAVAGTDYAAPTSGTSILLGNGSGGYSSYTGSSCTNQFVRSLNGAGVATCASVQDEDLNLTDITLADFTNDASYAKTNVANTWTALQTFTNASSTLFSNIGTAYFGGTSTTTITANGSITLPSAALLTAPYASSTALSVSGTGYFGTASTSNLRISSGATFENLANGALAVNAAGAVYKAATTTFSTGLTYASENVTCDTASGSTLGCLSSGDWTTFNSKQAALAFSYPLLNSANTISLAFGTTTSNTWDGTQTFTNAPVLSNFSGLVAASGGAAYAVATSSLNANITGSAGSVANAATFNNSGGGVASGSTFNGSSALTISYNTIGAQPAGTYVTSVGATWPVISSGGTTPTLSWGGLATSSAFSTNSFVYTTASGQLASVATSSLNLPNAALQNSSLTINGTSISLGGSQTITAASSTLLADSNTFSGANAFANVTATGATSTTLAVTSVTSAIHLANGTGGVIAYTGSSCTNQFVRSLNGAGVATCASVQDEDLNLTDITLADFTNDASYAKTNVANTWTALQTFTNASSTLFSNIGTAYFGGTATSTFDSAGNLSLVSNGLTVGTSQLVVSGGNVGVSTTTPWGLLSLESQAGVPGFVVGSSTATSFIVDKYGRGGFGTVSPDSSSQLTVQAPSSGVSVATFRKTQAANDTGMYFTFGGGTTATTPRGYFGYTKTGSGASTFFTSGELADAMALRSEGAFQLSAGGGSVALTVDTSGRFGVGTTSPGSLLSIGNTTGWNFYDNGTTTSYAKGIDLKNGGCFAINGTCITGGGGTNYWTLSGSNLYNNSGTNIGIGTTTPGTALDVFASTAGGGIRSVNTALLGSSSGGGFLATASTTPTASGQRLGLLGFGAPVTGVYYYDSAITGWSEEAWSAGVGGSYLALETTAPGSASRTEKVRITGAGNVGVGTTTPWGALAISTTAQQSGTIPLLNIASTTNISLFTVLGNGNVGIGTTSPAAELHVQSSSGNSDILVTHSGGNGWNFGAISTDDSLRIAQYTGTSSAYSAKLTIASSTGYVGLGTTTPFRRLAITDTVSTAQAAIAYDTTNNTDILTSSVGDLFLYPSGNDALFNNGNLWVCTGGSGATNGCPSGTPSGFGNLIVETAVGVGSSTPFTALSLGANMSIVTTEKSLSDGATIAIDWKNGNQQVVTLGGNRAITFSNYISGSTLRLVLCQDGTGSRTITSWPAAVLWGGGSAPTLTTTANKCDVLTFLTTSATGTVRVLGSSVLNF